MPKETKVFDDVTFEWRGEKYKLPADEVFACLMRVESIISIGELAGLAKGRKSLPIVKIAAAFAELLRHAGAHVTDEEVYAGMFKEGQVGASAATTALFTLFIPRAAREEKKPSETAFEEAVLAGKEPAK